MSKRICLLPALPLGQRETAEYLLIHPPEEGSIQLHKLLPRHVGQYGPPLSLDHEIPHRGKSRLPAALVGKLRLVGNKMEFPTAMVEAALLDFMAAHGKARLVNSVAKAGGYVRA